MLVRFVLGREFHKTQFEGKINFIIVKDLSRFGRNYIQVGQYIDHIFPTYNIRFIALSDNVDTTNKDTSAMDMMPMVNLFNEWQTASTSKKIRAVVEANAKVRKYRTSLDPYGYVKGTDEKKLPVVDEPAASVVRRIFIMRSQGISIAILRTLSTRKRYLSHQIITMRKLANQIREEQVIYGVPKRSDSS